MSRRCATPGCDTLLRSTNPDTICGACDVAERRRVAEAIREGRRNEVVDDRRPAPPVPTDEGERLRLAEDLRYEGLSYEAIGKRLGISKDKAWQMLTRNTPEPIGLRHAPRDWWTEERIIEALIRWRLERGTWPRANTWKRRGEWTPGQSSVAAKFPNFDAAVKAAILVFREREREAA